MLVVRNRRQGVKEDNVMIILDDETLERINNGDPCDLPLRSIGIDSDLTIWVGRIDDAAMSKTKSQKEVIAHIFRNYEIKTEDHFEPYRIDSEAPND